MGAVLSRTDAPPRLASVEEAWYSGELGGVAAAGAAASSSTTLRLRLPHYSMPLLVWNPALLLSVQNQPFAQAVPVRSLLPRRKSHRT
jgi:hypothetical protein